MPTFVARIQPQLDTQDDEIVDLMGLGTVIITFEYSAANRDRAIRELSAELGWRGMGDDFWDAALSLRGKRVSRV